MMKARTHTPIDNLTGGLRPGTLTLIHGSTGAGKTTFLLCMASEIARRGGEVMYIDTEGNECSLPGVKMHTMHLPRFPEYMEEQTKLIANISRDVEESGRAPVIILDSITYNHSLEIANVITNRCTGNLDVFSRICVRPRLYWLEVQLRMLKDIAYKSGGLAFASAIFKPRTSSGFRCDYEFRLIRRWIDEEKVLVAEEPPEIRLKSIRCGLWGTSIIAVGEEFLMDEEILRQLDLSLIQDEWIGVIAGEAR
jgi:energy-coupling factor transporter ATP-binding protein EcfA2